MGEGEGEWESIRIKINTKWERKKEGERGGE
jgi:hypothetical protein